MAIIESNNTSQSIENSSIDSDCSNYYFEDYQSDLVEPLFNSDINNELYNRMAEQIRNIIDSNVLQSIAGVQPIDVPASEIFRLNFKYIGFRGKKLDLRLPDELFEME